MPYTNSKLSWWMSEINVSRLVLKMLTGDAQEKNPSYWETTVATRQKMMKSCAWQAQFESQRQFYQQKLTPGCAGLQQLICAKATRTTLRSKLQIKMSAPSHRNSSHFSADEFAAFSSRRRSIRFKRQRRALHHLWARHSFYHAAFQLWTCQRRVGHPTAVSVTRSPNIVRWIQCRLGSWNVLPTLLFQ